MSIVFFDLETTGLDPARHEIIQIAAVAIGSGWEEREEFEVKMNFDKAKADPRALEINSYNDSDWKILAIHPDNGITMFEDFLRRHEGIKLISRAGRSYGVAQLAGHNIAGFDIPFAARAFGVRDLFFPAAFQGLDTLQLASWWRHCQNGAVWKTAAPKDLKLGTLAEHFGIALPDAHDALADVRANVLVARALVEALGLSKDGR